MLSAGRSVVEERAVMFVSADTEFSRNRGGCRPLSNDEELDPGTSSARPLGVRLRFPRASDEAIGLGFFAELVCVAASCDVMGESWILNE